MNMSPMKRTTIMPHKITYFPSWLLKALSHLTDLARRSYTGAQICRFSGIGTSMAAQRKNGSTSSGHRQNIGSKISNGRRRQKCFNILKNFCRCAAGSNNRTTTAVLRYGFVNVGRAPVVPRNRSAALRCLNSVPITGTDVIPQSCRCTNDVLPFLAM